MSEINRMLRQLDQQGAVGELTLQDAEPAPAAQDHAAPANPALPPHAVTTMARALHNASAAQAVASGLAADEAAAKPGGQVRPGVVKDARRWRLPALVLLGAGAIGALVLTDPSRTPAQTDVIDASPQGDVAAGPAPAAAALPAADELTATSGDGTAASTPSPAAAVAPAANNAAPVSVASLAAAPQPTPASPTTAGASGATAAQARATVTSNGAGKATSNTTGNSAINSGTANPKSRTVALTKAATGHQGTPALTDSALARLGSLPPLLVAAPTSRIDKRNLAPSNEQRARTLMQAATELARNGQRQAALQRAQEALTIEPGHVPARQLAAVLHHEVGNPALALNLLREGVALEGSPPTLALLLARFLAHQNLGPEALVVLDRHGLNSADAEGLRAGLLAQQGAYGSALVAYENALRQQPGQATWWVGMAVALESEGQSARARQAYAYARQLGLAQPDLASYVDQRLRALE